MRLSQRITQINGGGSDGWGVFYKARQMVAEGVPVTELTIGEHDIRTSQDILAAMNASAMSGHTGYAMVPGTDDLRRIVADRIAARTAVPTTMDNILITPGGQAALFATHMAVCNPGDTALFIDPYYATYPSTLRGAGAVPKAIVTSPDTAFQPTRAALAEAAKGATSLLVNSPNNPTGAVYSMATMTAIAETCITNDLWLISDEVYDTQVWEGEHISPRSLPGMAERTLVVGSMSKSHAMTGSRVGWVCGPSDVISRLIDLAINTTYGVAGFVQDAAHFALGQGVEVEEAVAAPFRRRRALALEALDGQNVVRAVPAQGAMYVMLDIRATGLSGEAFADALLEAELIAVMPGESFGQAAAGHVRVAMTVADEAFTDALKRLVRFAQNHAKVAAQ
jgi:arginine:pyruvate transaminase